MNQMRHPYMIYIDEGMPPMPPNWYFFLIIFIWNSLHIYRRLKIIQYILMPHIRYISIQNPDFYIEIYIFESTNEWFSLYIDASYSMNLSSYRSLFPSLSLSGIIYVYRHSGMFFLYMNISCSISLSRSSSPCVHLSWSESIFGRIFSYIDAS